MTAISSLITAFFQDYLPQQRGASPHTRDAYADSFRLLFEFARHGALDLSGVITQTVPLEADAINRALDGLDEFSEGLRTVITP